MFASCQILIRAASLMFATGMFAGLWVNDQPVVESRQTLLQELVPAPVVLSEDEWTAWVAVSEDPSEQNALDANEARDSREVAAVTVTEEFTDEWQPLPAASIVIERPVSQQTEEVVRRAPTSPVQRRTIDSEHLSLPLSLIQRHLDLLPAEIETGDYRIIDPYGGVGWLFIRNTDESRDENSLENDNESGVWTTSIDGVSVRFIRAAPQPDRII